MRKVILFNLITLDGYFTGAKGDISWHSVDEEFNVFADEQLDSYIKLLFLRSRWLSMDTGRFTSKDTYQDYTRPLTLNGWSYVEADPINRVDPSGRKSIIDDLLEDPSRAYQLVGFSKLLYSKQGLLRNCALTPDDGVHATDTVDDLLTDYICEYGPQHRFFTANDHLTRELAYSESIYELREMFYKGGAHPLGPDKTHFNLGEVGWATVDTLYSALAATGHDVLSDCQFDGAGFVKISTNIKAMFPASITHFLGSYDYQVTLAAGNRVRFVIHNQTDLASGTRLPLRFTGISLEEYLDNPTAHANDQVLSVLQSKTRQQTIGSEGGGNFEQTFIWDEQFLPQFASKEWFPPWPFGLPLVTVLP